MKNIKKDYENGLNVAVCSTRKDYTDGLLTYGFTNKITDCYDYISKLQIDDSYHIRTLKSLINPHLEPVEYKVYDNDEIIDNIETYLDTLSYTYFHGDLTTSHKQQLLVNKDT